MATKNELTLSERKYIKDNYTGMTIKEIAFNLDKPELLISEFIEKHLKEHKQEEAICPVLRTKKVWKLLQQQFSPDELSYFEHSYNSMREQFKEDIMATEEKQIFQAIELEILMHRNKKQQYSTQLEIERLDQLIHDLENSDAEDFDRKTQLVSFLNSAKASIPATAKQYTEHSEKYTKILGSLKATREQRIKVYENSKVDILGMIKAHEEQKYREKQMDQMEIMKAALLAEQKRLGSLHTYADKKLDTPILNATTIKNIKSDENKNS
jgi:hypothetical protein